MSGPHQTRIGNREFKQVLTVVRSDCGQSETGPSAVCDQSIDRINAPISPPPARTSSLMSFRSVVGEPDAGGTAIWLGISFRDGTNLPDNGQTHPLKGVG